MAETGRRARTDPLASFLDEEARLGSWPGAVWSVSEGDRIVSSGAVGRRAIVPAPAPASEATIYDLASLTKPLVTAALLGLLEEQGAIDLSTPAGAILPGLACARPDGRPTLLDLATHRSGLPAWRPLYARAFGAEEVLAEAIRLDAEGECGERVVYSDPGFILLGEALRRITGEPLDALFRKRISGPLGLPRLRFQPAGVMAREVAPTELGNRYERNLASGRGIQLEPGRLRETLIAGEVHDGNAHALGGVAGHAGLFGDAGSVRALAREFLGRGSGLFGPRALARFSENLTPGLGEGRTLGWKRAVGGAREAEGILSVDAFGHTGFTGTSLWIDPSDERIYVLLTNRVHPEVRPIEMNLKRRRFHELARSLG